ncbi:MAG: glycosyltransferase [bacterium]|nr:glycosyltransferase [bacterium]
MPVIWSYSDPADRGFGLFKRRIFNTLREMGWDARLALAPLLDPASKKTLRDDLLKTRPGWILLINQSAGQLYEYLQLDVESWLRSTNKIVWYLDDPRFFVDRPFEPVEFAFSFDETYLDFLQSHHPGGVGFMPLASDVDRVGVMKNHFCCDVCFVGGVIDQSARRAQLSPEMRDYVDRLVERKLVERGRTFDELAILEPYAPGKCIQIQPQVANYLYWEANNRYRIRVMESLSDYDLRIYGNEDWPVLLKDSPLLKKFHGRIDPVTELPDLFASARVNINIHSIQCLGSLNQRDFNAPLAGGFLLSDWVPAAPRYFEPGVEAIYWSDVDDLRAKIDFYLEHVLECRRVIARGRARCERDHHYAARVDGMLSVLRSFPAARRAL